MLKIITNIGKSGLQTWFIQRLTAVVLGLYTCALLGFWLYPGQRTYLDWQALFSNQSMKYITTIVLVALLIHAWIGVWTVATDYLNTVWLRFIAQMCMYVTLLFYLIWGLQILWL